MSFVKKYKKIIFIIIPVIAAFLIIITLTNKNLIARLKGEAYAESGFTDQNFYNCVVEAYNSVNYGNVIETETHEEEVTEEPIEDEWGESVRKYGYYQKKVIKTLKTFIVHGVILNLLMAFLNLVI